ncbi:NADH ubiquinone oxidoreductase [Salipiger sp. IMCC34102]|uniref:CIA30 family protein n=1 Tax=Salipiger sp. IMCC34102 TaxID=2510647 RepID=UPI00101BDA20|nr:CIA30 family protein [Salipiger sp. IMCC34102]RYH02273.1 NADH ubiquinone oxidoreductase [Salipiger sp. IMCC34102]
MHLTFDDTTTWRFISDQVMGGASEGAAELRHEDGRSFAALRGEVSTDNGGGFLQVRREVEGLPKETRALAFDVRGNGEMYEVHLRTVNSDRPWHYYTARFTAPAHWETVTLPLSDFESNGRGLTAELRPQDLRGIGLVAYGRDYTARLDMAQIETVD